MGRLSVPRTADPASHGRKGPANDSATHAVGNETSADVSGAMNSQPGPGSKKNSGTENLGYNSAQLKAALP